ncbi:MAG: acetylornithine transaminase [Chloroflexi bacterium]|nr:acetylornithine transaminase [Chloroflexota bacterium]
MPTWQELEAKYYMKTFVRQPVVLVRGEGCRVWDESGRPYLDMVAGLAVNILGHGHPRLVEAIREQAGTLIHTTNLYYTIPQLQLAELIVERTRGGRIFFANSGAEANEGAIKLARKYGRLHRGGAYQIISADDSFHGRTLATVAATGQPKLQAPFAPMPAGFTSVPFNDLEAIERATTPETCAIILEVVQGESGVNIGDHDYLVGVRRWCDEQGLLLILDEIQTGMGRTGRFLAQEHHEIIADVFTLAKGLAGGVPIGAVVATEKASVFTPSDHGSTFGGNPLACAAGVATMKTLIDEQLIENSARVGAHLLGRLRWLQARHSVIERVRGLGLMAAFDLKQDVAPAVVRAALERGLILNNTSARTVRLIPPLIITAAEVDEAVETIDRVLAAL